MGPVKTLIKKLPGLYNFASRCYSAIRPVHLRELFIGTRAQEQWWAKRHLRQGSDWGKVPEDDKADEWLMGYWHSRNHPHRVYLAEKIAAYAPVDSVLEIGCNCGPTLYQVAKRSPGGFIRGIDINPRAVEKGNELLAKAGVYNVKLQVGKADELSQFAAKSFDIVFTNSLLMFVGPDKIENIASEMVRIARVAVVLLEWHTPQSDRNSKRLDVYRYGAWERDYQRLFSKFASPRQVFVERLPEHIWQEDQRWSELGAVVEIVLDKTRKKDV